MSKLLTLYLLWSVPVVAAEYDPLSVSPSDNAQGVRLSVHDGTRQREIPLKVYLPPARDPSPVVLFSHGLGGTREGSAFLGKHWSARGYVVVFLQHPGSDDSVWKSQLLLRRMTAMRQAASAENFLHRVKDVPAVLHQLNTWNKEKGHALAGRLDLSRVGMSGHSFGAVTTQAVSGQSYLGKPRYADTRIRAAVIFSPSSPRRGDPQRAFADVKIPWLLMTGTKDTARIGGQTVETRLAVYPALPAGNKYELLLHNAEHSAFTERPLPGDTEKRNPNHHRVILALSTAFWDAFLRNNHAAKSWLNSPAPHRLLQDQDRWQRK